jgi:DnaJ-class molecular chaperone
MTQPGYGHRAYATCPSCNGSGLTLSTYTGEPTDCYECNGDGWVRNRDEKGRFVGNPKEASHAQH